YVKIMSLHKSKGLSAKLVVVMGCVNGLVPFVNSNATPGEAAEIEEEQRRLFYVALTRTRDTLLLSSCSRVERALAWSLGMQVLGKGGRVAPCVASSFLA